MPLRGKFLGRQPGQPPTPLPPVPPPARTPQGKFWLLAGFANPDSVLYGEELRAAQEGNPGRMRHDVALSLTQKNARGGPLYVQASQQNNNCCCPYGCCLD